MKITQEEFEELQESCGGICLACGCRQESGVKPDACNYLCESCGKRQVFGVEELLVQDRLTIIDDVEDEDEDDELEEDEDDDNEIQDVRAN